MACRYQRKGGKVLGTENEVWKSIPGFEGSYEASDFGRIRSLPRVVHRKLRGKVIAQPRKLTVLKTWLTKDGYLQVRLVSGDCRPTHLVHRLVLLAFVGPCPTGMEVCHGNGIGTDNRLENLRYGTHIENSFDKEHIHGTVTRSRRGEFASC